MSLIFRPGRERSATSGVALAAAGCALVLALTGCSGSSGVSAAPGPAPSTSGRALAAVPPSAGATYTLMQMNMCLSGIAGCYWRTAYPAVVQEAETRIREGRPDAVTLNETCEGDAAEIARRTGYQLRFSRIIYLGRPFPCVRPSGRGLFGDAVLTEAAIENTDNHNFATELGIERRRWLCVTTRVRVDVCTAHLNTRSSEEVVGNDAQCAELRQLLERRAAAGPVIFGGDVNRRGSCAPAGFWTRTDASARQDPGLQQVYGSRALRAPSTEVVPAVHSDHDVLLVRAHFTRKP